jgi:hypothetical protein
MKGVAGKLCYTHRRKKICKKKKPNKKKQTNQNKKKQKQQTNKRLDYQLDLRRSINKLKQALRSTVQKKEEWKIFSCY